jgi:hypothetical protein
VGKAKVNAKGLPDGIDWVWFETIIATDDGKVFGFRSGDKEAVERITVMPGEF